jgi:hypothetical protein
VVDGEADELGDDCGGRERTTVPRLELRVLYWRRRRGRGGCGVADQPGGAERRRGSGGRLLVGEACADENENGGRGREEQTEPGE